MCQLYILTWYYKMGTLLKLDVPVLKWGKELKKKKIEEISSLYVRVCAHVCFIT